MKKVMVYAYTHFNLGDDLFLKILFERYPETMFVLYAPQDYKQTFDQYKNIKVWPSDSLFLKGINFIFKLLGVATPVQQLLAKTCDAAVQIGGSMFIQSDKWQKEFTKTKVMYQKGKPFFLLGANFGPYNDKEFYLKHKLLFQGYTDISFREKYSYNLFRDLPNVRMSDDIVLQLNQPYTSQQHHNNHDQHTKRVAISVIKPSIRKYLAAYDNTYYEKIADIAGSFIEKGYPVTLISFCNYEQDHEAIKEIKKRLPEKYVHHVTAHYYRTNINDTLNLVAESRCIIATRFHAMILGWVYGKPTFPIIYSAKMKHAIEDSNFQGDYCDFDQLANLTAERVFKSIQTNHVDISQQAKRAEKHFKKLDELLVK